MGTRWMLRIALGAIVALGALALACGGDDSDDGDDGGTAAGNTLQTVIDRDRLN